LPRRHRAWKRSRSGVRYRPDDRQRSGHYWHPESPSDYYWRPEPRAFPSFNQY
jgi:hypothetical protein